MSRETRHRPTVNTNHPARGKTCARRWLATAAAAFAPLALFGIATAEAAGNAAGATAANSQPAVRAPVATAPAVATPPPAAVSPPATAAPTANSQSAARNTGEPPVPLPAAAAAPPPERIESVVVVAPAILKANDVDPYGSSSAVVGRGQLEDLNAPDLGSALRTVPGVTIARRNIIGSYGGSGGGALYVRGMGMSRPGGEITTLYDGVPRLNAVFSHPLLDLLSVDAARSIRVLKSPQPQEFGNAFAAIAIEPRQPPETFASGQDGAPASDGFGGELAAAYGTHDTVSQSAIYNLRRGDTELTLGQSFRRSSGHRPNSGGELQDYFGRASQRLGKNWTATAVFDHTDNRAEDPGGKGSATRMGDYRTRDFMTVVTLANQFDDAHGYIKPYWHHGNAFWGNQNPGGAPAATRDTDMRWDNYGVRIREVFNPIPGGEFIAGFDYDAQTAKMRAHRNDATALPPFRRRELQTYSPHAAVSQLLGDANGFHLRPSAGLRFYAHNVFKSENAPHASLTLGHKDTTRLHISAARGVSYPGLNVAVLSESTIPSIVNNTADARRRSWKDLRSEVLRHYEIGLTQRLAPALQASLTAFMDESRHRYAMVTVTPPAALPSGGYGPKRFTNDGGYRTRGIEAALAWNPTSNFTLFAGGTWLDSNVSGLPYAPEWSASAGFTWRILDDFRLSLDLAYQDAMHISPDGLGRTLAATAAAAANRRVPAFLLLNARLSYDLPVAKLRLGLRHCEVFLAAENLLDRTYYHGADATGALYPMPGLGFHLGLRAAF